MSVNRTSQPTVLASAAIALAMLVSGCSSRDAEMAEKLARAEAAASRAESAAMRAEAAAKRVPGAAEVTFSDDPEPQEPTDENATSGDAPDNLNPVG